MRAVSEVSDGAPLPAARAAFAEMLSSLYVCAGNPTLEKVAANATAAQRLRNPKAPALTTQRISDWRGAKSLPKAFESVAPVIQVLINEAQRRNTPPTMDGLYDLRQWQRWWNQARTASDDATDQAPQIPETTCPYQGLAAFEATDSARFFGRARSTGELVALIQKVRADNPGIVLLTGPSGAGKSSLLSAGLSAAISSGALDTDSEGSWVAARMTPGNDPMTALRRCLDQPDIAGRADGMRVLIIVDQGEELFGPDVSPEARAEFLDVLHTLSQPSMSTPRVVVIGLRADVLGHCVDIPELADAVQSRCMVLGAMKPAELHEVVVEPAKAAGLRIEAGLVDLILNDVGAEKKSAAATRLPLLSHGAT